MSRAIAAVAFVCVSLLLLGGVGLQGQEKQDPPAKGKVKLPTYWTKLGLSAAQKENYAKIKAEYHEKIAPVEGQLKKLHEEEKEAIFRILTPDQREQLRKLVTEKVGGAGEGTEPKKVTPAKE